VIPLCRSCHQAQHMLGWEEFLRRARLSRRHLELALEQLEQAAYPPEENAP